MIEIYTLGLTRQILYLTSFNYIVKILEYI